MHATTPRNDFVPEEMHDLTQILVEDGAEEVAESIVDLFMFVTTPRDLNKHGSHPRASPSPVTCFQRALQPTNAAPPQTAQSPGWNRCKHR